MSILLPSVTTLPLFLPQLPNVISANISGRTERVFVTKRRFGSKQFVIFTFWKKATTKSVEHFLVMGCYVLFLLFKRIHRFLYTSLLARFFFFGSFSCYLSWIMNKSLSTVIHLGFRNRSCGGGFPFTNTVTLTEQLNRIYDVPFLLPIFFDVDGFLRNSAENLTGNIITDFYSQN